MNDLFESLKLFDETRGEAAVIITGAGRAYKAALAAYKTTHEHERVLFVCENDYEAKKYYAVFSDMMDAQKLFFFPKRPLYFTYADSMSRSAVNDRIRTVKGLYENREMLVVTSIWALSENMPFFSKEDIVRFSVGETHDMRDIAAMLVRYGYQREDRTESPGQFSVRGGILDVYSAASDKPFRIEFDADQIDSIRSYNPETQLSVKNAAHADVSPFSEVLLETQNYASALKKFKSAAEKAVRALSGSDEAEEISADNARLIENFTADPSQGAAYIYMYADVQRKSLLDIAEGAFVMLCEPAALKKGYESMRRMTYDNHVMLSEKALAFPEQIKVFSDYKTIMAKVNGMRRAALSAVDQPAPLFSAQAKINAACADLAAFSGNINLFFKNLAEYTKSGYKVIVGYYDEKQKTRLISLFETIAVKTDENTASQNVSLVRDPFPLGLDFARQKILIVPAAFIIAKNDAPKKNRRMKNADAFFADIKPGDYVVHDYHGIGRYEGIVQMRADTVTKDYIKIAYAKEDVLYVPPEQMNLLQKYVGAGEAAPKITRLGTNDWAAAKKKASAVLKELASEYIGMYAVRRAVKGYAFSEDTAWQAEFEEKFQYEPTPDQLTSSEEIKRDMQRDVPMDRLLCADVGYGKTEVAVRAAFKAAADSKQTAILVPTTILALQHYNSFVERFKGYPIRIEMMSRFKTSAQIKKIKDCLKKGAVDIVIGTQKILADDIRFKDLGLLIVDEEQRFGVAQKDKLKLMKTNVDTLSLSATPIPRTLHMSLSGIRDMSVIRTPPENRFPVQTYVMQYEDIIVKEAIQNELARGGQVFYVHNRTETIEQRCAHVAALVPGARVVYAHGQMKESALEDIIIRFLNKEFDVLVCTTIIENGIDIINANTIIIEDADRLGLSQLYQLRGRVGRSDVTAYAYMLYRRDAALSEVSSKRLQAIKQFTQFGSGFKIALRDLQIRGSGNILGARQHGNFGNVGYEMYCRLLSQAIDAQKGIEKPAEQATEIDLDIDAYIPASYIESEEERIEAYKKIALVTSEKDFTELYGDLADVYADPPACVLNLLHTALIKSGAQKANIKKLKSAGGRLTIDFFENTVFGGDFIMRLSQSYRFKVKNKGTDTSLVFYLQQDADIIKYTSDLIAIFIGK